MWFIKEKSKTLTTYIVQSCNKYINKVRCCIHQLDENIMLYIFFNIQHSSTTNKIKEWCKIVLHVRGSLSVVFCDWYIPIQMFFVPHLMGSNWLPSNQELHVRGMVLAPIYSLCKLEKTFVGMYVYGPIMSHWHSRHSNKIPQNFWPQVGFRV